MYYISTPSKRALAIRYDSYALLSGASKSKSVVGAYFPKYENELEFLNYIDFFEDKQDAYNIIDFIKSTYYNDDFNYDNISFEDVNELQVFEITLIYNMINRG
jgi:hypothetical protein